MYVGILIYLQILSMLTYWAWNVNVYRLYFRNCNQILINMSDEEYYEEEEEV